MNTPEKLVDIKKLQNTVIRWGS